MDNNRNKMIKMNRENMIMTAKYYPINVVPSVLAISERFFTKAYNKKEGILFVCKIT